MATVNTKSLQEQNAGKRQKFAKSFDRSRRQLRTATNETVRRMEELISDLRRDVQGRMATFLPGDPGAPFGVNILPVMTEQIDEAIEEFERRAGVEIGSRMEGVFEIGSRVTAGALVAAGVPVTFPSVSAEILSALTADITGLIEGLGEGLLARISNRIQATAVGLQPASVTMVEVTKLLRNSRQIAGVRRRMGFAFQAETITRTELGRVYSNAQQAAAEEIATTIPGLKKRWVTTLKERRGHLEAERAYAEGGSIGPISIKQRFKVIDFTRTGRSRFFTFGRTPPRVVKTDKDHARSGRPITDRMLFPRDPSASAGNTINCSCISVEVVPDLEKATNQSKGIIES